MSDLVEVPHSRQNAIRFFERYVEENQGSIAGKVVYDLSAGSGYIASLFERAGAIVTLFDLFPEQNKFAKGSCQRIDLQERFPLGDSTADLVICSETIEHLPNQFFFFQETARIIKRDGVFLLTTPNSSSLRSRFSQFLMESEHYSNPAPNELDAFARWEGSDKGYFAKLFISGVLRLRTLAAINGLSIKRLHPSSRSSTSYLLMIFYPWIYYFGKKNLRRQLNKDKANAGVYWEIFKTNTSTDVLLGKHLIMELVKQS